MRTTTAVLKDVSWKGCGTLSHAKQIGRDGEYQFLSQQCMVMQNLLTESQPQYHHLAA